MVILLQLLCNPAPFRDMQFYAQSFGESLYLKFALSENCQYISICNPENPSTLVVTMLHQCDTWHAHATLSHCLDTTLSVQNLKTLLMWNCMKKRNVGCQYQPWRSWLSWICTNQILVLGSRQDQVLLVKVLFSSIVSLNHSIYFLETNLFKHASLKNPWASRSKLEMIFHRIRDVGVGHDSN